MKPNLEEVIEKFMAFAVFRDNALSAQGEGLSPEFERRVTELAKLANPGLVVALIQHYEKKLARAEADSLRMAIFKQAVKEQIAEGLE